MPTEEELVRDAQALARAGQIKGQKILQDSMDKYKHEYPGETFENFLKDEWPEDHVVYQEYLNKNPGFTRDYRNWRDQFAQSNEEDGGLVDYWREDEDDGDLGDYRDEEEEQEEDEGLGDYWGSRRRKRGHKVRVMSF
jgi:hypothetical protein